MDNNGYQAPWERPEIKSILSIFSGKVVSTKQTNLVYGYSYGGNNDDTEDIQR